MKSISMYLASISTEEQRLFAERCGTSVNYLRKAVSIGQRIGLELCIRLERESSGAISCEALRPDVDWAFIRGSAAAQPEGQGA